MKGNHYDTVEGLKEAASQVLKDITAQAFAECYDAWRKRMLQCIKSEGEYFEGDHVEIDTE